MIESMNASVFLLKGIVLGFSIAAPVGPIGILCIRRTLDGGMSQGLISGVGAATADAIYGLIAACGITAVGSFLTAHDHWLRLGGGLFLLFLGFSIFRSRPSSANTESVQITGRFAAFASTFGLTLTNPMTILSFAAVFAGLGAGNSGSGWLGSSLLVLGVFSGSLLWWLFLSLAVGQLRARLNFSRLVWINRLSGIMLCAFGLMSLFALLP